MEIGMKIAISTIMVKLILGCDLNDIKRFNADMDSIIDTMLNSIMANIMKYLNRLRSIFEVFGWIYVKLCWYYVSRLPVRSIDISVKRRQKTTWKCIHLLSKTSASVIGPGVRIISVFVNV